ncbi:hypothetical protein GCM10010112_83080 [Actinoplanes lobatus]|uniref:NlpC/P60 domain-containing protein n=1 Tax=Actinoplanes lobatus TaxID=113568 RepID=A0A7W7HL32_9ACTN|nr:hypothetical protein [Actinoplanes lobatus]MBB4752504.1 hypothetical protein [Actinoplanes lobatus]GGN94090.1 hypothetical protein GCM10010112_83080 [Actinoplanes lobatus]GIE44804.1 hypothetical protein Alo02nite_77020 [Actinoplanes lobatus]
MHKLIVGAVVACLAIPLLAVTALLGSGGTPCAVASSGTAEVDGWDGDQIANAHTIVTVGMNRGVPQRGWVIAVATAIQESGLRNLSGGDRDSVGLFQQRPSQGWGSPTQLQDPVYATGKFYDKLITVNGWQQMPLTAAAQAVQLSAYPNAYARHEPAATTLIDQVTAGSETVGDAPCGTVCATGCTNTTAVFARARSWLTAWSGGPVPYLSSGDPTDWFHGYRRDCSGYVSMTLGLPGPGLNTAGLAARSTTLTKSQLQPGDLLINTAPNLRGHVVLFERWTDPSMTRYHGYEQSGDGGTHYRTIPYPYYGTYPMTPYRLTR